MCVVLLTMASFYVVLFCVICVFCLLVVLIRLSVPAEAGKAKAGMAHSDCG